jgi:hypothetical protein
VGQALTIVHGYSVDRAQKRCASANKLRTATLITAALATLVIAMLPRGVSAVEYFESGFLVEARRDASVPVRRHVLLLSPRHLTPVSRWTVVNTLNAAYGRCTTYSCRTSPGKDRRAMGKRDTDVHRHGRVYCTHSVRDLLLYICSALNTINSPIGVSLLHVAH